LAAIYHRCCGGRPHPALSGRPQRTRPWDQSVFRVAGAARPPGRPATVVDVSVVFDARPGCTSWV